ncbi:hypothetical protein CPB86DRAFT_761732 [Serendipita vermifera]|nr:hypothetical protein CPB86DRAFT_761732 [Serendipita vermifera]
MEEAALATLAQTWPGRESVISTLYGFWSSSPPAFIHICDPITIKETGKLVSKLLSAIEGLPNARKLLSVQVDATECVNQRVTFEKIINGLVKWAPDWENGALSWRSKSGEGVGNSLDTFLHALRAVSRETMEEERSTASSMVVIVNNADRLKDNVPGLITPLARLSDLTSLPICVTFLSQLPWEEVRLAIGSSVVPYVVHLQPPTSNDIMTSLRQRFEELVDDSCINPFHSILRPIFDSYVEFVYAICNAYTQDPEEIGYVVATHWAHYISPILNDWEEENEKGEDYDIPIEASSRLRALFRQTIGASVPVLYPRLVDASTWASQMGPQSFRLRFSETDRNTVIHGRRENESTTNGGTQTVTSLPKMARYLLVASYLGSFNPSTMDIRILGQMRDPTKKYRRPATRKARPDAALKIGHLLSGPAVFSSDRLWAISGALFEAFDSGDKPPWYKHLDSPGMFSETEVTRAHFAGQIDNLVSRRLLIRTTPQEKVEVQAMYRCAISMEQASAIADSLDFKLGPLLYEESQ